MLIGYARVSTSKQDAQGQVAALTALGIAPERLYVDQGYTGRNTARPRRSARLWRPPERATMPVVTKLDRLGLLGT